MLTRFSELEQIHERLDELFLSHQAALVRLDVAGARKLLSRFRVEIEKHIRFEEKVLLPLYADRGGDDLEGGRVLFYLKEHRKILESLAELTDDLGRLSLSEGEESARAVVAFLEREHPLKALIEHHDRREHTFLYAFLDQVTTDPERQEILAAAPLL